MMNLVSFYLQKFLEISVVRVEPYNAKEANYKRQVMMCFQVHQHFVLGLLGFMCFTKVKMRNIYSDDGCDDASYLKSLF